MQAVSEGMQNASTALIADDHELFRVALSELLTRHHGCGRVIAASSFDEAMDHLDGEPGIGLALFDLVMPGMSGAGGLAAVRRSFPETRVVVVSGSERREDILAALAAGVHGYIPKTLSLPAIDAALRRVLQGEVYVPAVLAALPPDSAPRPDAESRAPALTGRQREVLALLREGRSNKEIARALGLGPGTVKVHVAAVLRALGVASRTGVATLDAAEADPGTGARPL